MPYSDFSIEDIPRRLGYRTRGADLFPGLAPVPVPEWLTAILAKNTALAYISEKARSESIISPVLAAAREVTGNKLAVFSGQRLDADPARGLSGECDFILALTDPVPPLQAPVVTVVEAKKADIELGLGQCVAEMVGAQTFNEAAGEGYRPVFGCVSSGEVWQFLRLDGNLALLHTHRYLAPELGLILAVFREIVAAYEAATPTPAP
jgi:hypothetical protein